MHGDSEGMQAEQKRKKTKSFFSTQPQKYPSPGRMAETPRACTGDSGCWFRHYQWSTLINRNSNLSMCGTFLKHLLPPLDICHLLSTQKEAYDVNLSAVCLFVCLFFFECAFQVMVWQERLLHRVAGEGASWAHASPSKSVHWQVCLLLVFLLA